MKRSTKIRIGIFTIILAYIFIYPRVRALGFILGITKEQNTKYEISLRDNNQHLILADIDTNTTKTINIGVGKAKWSPNGKWLAVIDYDRRVWIVDADSGVNWQISQDNNNFDMLGWSQSSNKLALQPNESLNQSTLFIYDLNTRALTPLISTELIKCEYNSIAWSFDDNWIVCGSGQRAISINLDGTIIDLFESEAGRIPSLILTSPQNYKVAIQAAKLSPVDSGSAWDIYLADITQPKSAIKVNDETGIGLWANDWSKDGSKLFAAPLQRVFETYSIDLNSGKKEVLFTGYWSSGDLSPNGDKLAMPNSNSNIDVVYAQNGRIADIGDHILWRYFWHYIWGLETDGTDICGWFWGSNNRINEFLLCHYYPDAMMSVDVARLTTWKTKLGGSQRFFSYEMELSPVR